MKGKGDGVSQPFLFFILDGKMRREWYNIKNAVRVEYRLLSLSTSYYLEIVHKKRILVVDRRFYTFKENDVPTPANLVIFKNTKYILAVSDREYEAKDCNVITIPSLALSQLRERLSELPILGLGLPKFLIGLPDFEYEKENEILYFYLPHNLFVKDKETQEKVKKQILPRIILDYPLNDDERFYDNSYPLPYVSKFKLHADIFFVNADFDYIVHYAKGDYKVYYLPAEISTHEFNFTITKQRINCARKTLEQRGLTRLKVSLEDEKVKIGI